MHPPKVEGKLMTILAICALVVNLTILAVLGADHDDINLKPSLEGSRQDLEAAPLLQEQHVSSGSPQLSPECPSCQASSPQQQVRCTSF